MTLPYQSSTFVSTPAGRNADLFQPPKSPASTVASPALATSTDYFSSHSRKRQRPDSSHSNSHEQQQTPLTATPSWVQCPTPSDGAYIHSAQVNERYRLAGGFDTPGLLAADGRDEQFGRLSEFDMGRRRVRDVDDQAGGQQTQSLGPLARERNGVARIPSSPNAEQPQRGWTSFAFGLVGKVFNFGTSVVKGFYAGGGQGYDMRGELSTLDRMLSAPRQRDSGTPVPGSWREDADEFLGDFEQDNPNSPSLSQARPPNKRRQTDKDSWVMVGTPDHDPAGLSPRRKAASTNIPLSRPSLGVRTSASKATGRRSLAPVSRRQSSFVTHTGSPALTHTTADHLNRRASLAPTRPPRPNSSTGATARVQDENYISPEASRFVKRQAKQEKVADKAMSSMSKRLEDLIRQGQEALGTKVSVSGDADGEMDEGFVDEEW